MIHKLAVDEAEESGSRTFQRLAADLQALLGENQVEYEGIVVALLPRDEASTAVEKAREAGHIAGRFDDWSLELPSHRWDVRDGAGRVGPWEGNAEVESVVLPGLAWVQFAYPIRPEWYELLRECWAEPLLAVPNQAILVFAADLDQIAGCGGLGAYLSLVEPMLSTDRATPELVSHEGPIEVTLTPGSTQEALAAALGPEYEIEDQSATENDVVLLVEGPDAARVLLAEPMVVSVTAAGREPVLSDERQALTLARQWSTIQGQGYPQEPASSSSGTYLQWLGNRQLRGLTNQRRIAFFDSGVDSGNPASFHPDLAGRVIHSLDITTSSLFDTAVSGWTDVQRAEDSSTHGTSVIGVGIGAGVNAGRNPTNFAQGQGIAPDATALSLKMWRRNRLTNDPNNCGQDLAFGTWGPGTTNQTAGHRWAWQQGARVANHSWNFSDETSYNFRANNLDRFVRDSIADQDSGENPMAIVVSAGNFGASQNPVVRSPGTAKNVVTVGSVDSAHPGPASCGSSIIPTPDPIGNAFEVSAFSSRGALFGVGQTGLHQVRIKPDLVAPGWRVEGPRRAAVETGCPVGPCGVSLAGPPVYTWTGGTSFATPAISGALALKSTQLQDGMPNIYPTSKVAGFTAMPSLLKAAAIATARSLGPVVNGVVSSCTAGDCRPSPYSGWGLLDLDRLTNRTTRVYAVNESESGKIVFDAAGQSWVSPVLRPHDPSQDLVIALVWNDIPTSPQSPALQRDLDLLVQEYQGSQYWVGNNFWENSNLVQSDTGYSQAYGFYGNYTVDRINTVEVVAIPPGQFSSETRFQFVVSAFNHAADANPIFANQSFSVYAWNLQCAGSC